MSHAYLGPLGGLVGFRCPTAEPSTPVREQTSHTTMGGHLKVKRSARARRTWQVGLGTATPPQFASLAALTQFGTPPWWWVSAWAQVTNVLTPRQSMLLDGVVPRGSRVTPGGAVTTSDGMYVPHSLTVTASLSQTRVGFFAPVIPGVPVTVSAYLRAISDGSARVRACFVDITGADYGMQKSGDLGGTTITLDRLSATGLPPEGAAGVCIRVEGANQVAAPAITYTEDLLDWFPGQGADQVVASIPETAPILATREARTEGRLTAMSMTVQEL